MDKDERIFNWHDIEYAVDLVVEFMQDGYSLKKAMEEMEPIVIADANEQRAEEAGQS